MAILCSFFAEQSKEKLKIRTKMIEIDIKILESKLFFKTELH
jgi:hypothetical protein